MELDITEIKNYLPHRYPFLLLDRIKDYQAGESLAALKNVTVNEPFFEGHFPAQPVMPGVLIVEAIAQACAIFASLEVKDEIEVDIENRLYFFTGIDKARFKRPVSPGDQLILEVEIKRRIQNMWKCQGKATVDGEIAATAELMFTYKDI